MTNAVYFIIMAIVAVIVITLATKTNMLRDVSEESKLTENALKANIKEPKAPFSLARTQFAFWTVIIFSSFLYILFKQKFTIPEINNVNLILLGIVVSTSASAKLIDNSQKNNGDLSQDNPSEGFLTDILSDKKGVSVHRLQNVLWTIAVGIIYIQYVASESNLPDNTVISDNLLLLMGISTGAYLGIKTTENSN
jgi:hypothetical protein